MIAGLKMFPILLLFDNPPPVSFKVQEDNKIIGVLFYSVVSGRYK